MEADVFTNRAVEENRLREIHGRSEEKRRGELRHRFSRVEFTENRDLQRVGGFREVSRVRKSDWELGDIQ